MLQRLFPLVLALVVGATPIAREFCRVSCTEHQASTSSPHGDHGADGAMAGHEMPDHALGVPDTETSHPVAHHASLHDGSQHAAMPCCELSLSAAPHACDHGNESLAASVPATKLAINSPAIVPQVVSATSPRAVEVPFAAGYTPALGPIPIALRTPLRV